ncbi:hypothetical protein B6U96_05955 [Archaeoglobales archaeon ex4484_92]|nr:MAG: hypothetical protein B6U96_05955 [Archaeoglobales archaeon ex4484_92]
MESFRYYSAVLLLKFGGTVIVFASLADFLRLILILCIIMNLFTMGEESGLFSLFLPSILISLGKYALIIATVVAAFLSLTVVYSGYKLYKLGFKAEKGLLRIEEKQKIFSNLISQFIVALLVGAYITALGLGAVILGFIFSC